MRAWSAILPFSSQEASSGATTYYCRSWPAAVIEARPCPTQWRPRGIDPIGSETSAPKGPFGCSYGWSAAEPVGRGLPSIRSRPEGAKGLRCRARTSNSFAMSSPRRKAARPGFQSRCRRPCADGPVLAARPRSTGACDQVLRPSGAGTTENRLSTGSAARRPWLQSTAPSGPAWSVPGPYRRRAGAVLFHSRSDRHRHRPSKRPPHLAPAAVCGPFAALRSRPCP